MSETADLSRNTYSVQSSSSLRTMIAQRSLYREASYVLPCLAKLPEKFVFCDVGCGPGSISFDVATKYPAATVLAIDIDTAEIEVAKKAAQEKGLTNVRFAVGNALHLDALADEPGFEALRGGCDVVHEHMVMMHVASPLLMMQQMYKALKPGGYAACRDHDPGMNTIYPLNPGLELYLACQPSWIGGRGADPQTGRKLLHFAVEAGFQREDIEASLGNWVYSSIEEKQVWLGYVNKSWREKEVVDKMMKAADRYVDPEQMVASWNEWGAQPDAWYALPSPQVLCQKRGVAAQ